MILWRARTGQVEVLPTPGTWIAAVRNIDSGTVDSEIRLGNNDLMVLYTDGVTEAMNEANIPFGIDALCREVADVADRTVDEIKEHLVKSVRRYMNRQQDDITLLVLRYHG